MTNQIYNIFTKANVEEIVTELLTSKKKLLIHLVRNVEDPVNPSRNGSAINRGNPDSIDSFIADPTNNRHYVLREKRKGFVRRMIGKSGTSSFYLEKKEGLCDRAFDEFDKFTEIYLYCGTLDQMIGEIIAE